jgi:hypothetical protein
LTNVDPSRLEELMQFRTERAYTPNPVAVPPPNNRRSESECFCNITDQDSRQGGKKKYHARKVGTLYKRVVFDVRQKSSISVVPDEIKPEIAMQTPRSFSQH